MFSRVATLALGLALVTACADQSPVEPVDEAQFARGGNSAAKAQLFHEIPVVGTIPGGTFEGTLTITELGLGTGRQLLASGVLEGETTVGAVTTTINQAFEDIPLDLTRATHSRCAILNLDLGPLFLDLLGLQVDLDEVHLDITAVTGPGRLLGNLLCGLVGLLDGLGSLANLLALLDRINDILDFLDQL